MKKEMLINVLQPEECRIAIVEDGVLEELYVERTSLESYTGNIYKGKIVNLEPAIQAAFVDFSVGRNGFLHVSDVEPQYYHRHIAADAEAAPRDRETRRDREPRRDRDDRRRPPRAEDRDAGGAPPPRERDRPDRSERGRRDRSEPRRFGEGLLGDDDVSTPPRPAEPVRDEPVRPEREEPRRGRLEPAPPARGEESSFGRGLEHEREPRVTPEPEEPRARGYRAPEPFDPDLPPSRTQRQRIQPPTPRIPDLDNAETGRSRQVGGPLEPEIESPRTPFRERERDQEREREPRRGRRGRGPRPAPETESLFESEPEPERLPEPPVPEPVEFEAEAEAEAGARPDLPRRRGGRAAIRSRGGDRDAELERPRERERPPAPTPPAPVPTPLTPEPERIRTPERERERPRAFEPETPRERGKPHDRAGEPGYVPRRERTRGGEPLFEPEPAAGPFDWVEPGAEVEPEGVPSSEAPLEDAGTGLDKVEGPHRRRRRRGRRRERGGAESSATTPDDREADFEDDELEAPPQLEAESPRRTPRPAEEEDDLDREFDFGDEPEPEPNTLDDDSPDSFEDHDEEIEGVAVASPEDNEIDPGLEEEIRREIEEIAELERDMGLRGTTEARPRRGDDREAEAGGRGPGRFSRGRSMAKPPIQEIFRRGDEVLVQVIKESIGTKGPTLSTYISIPGRYLVLMPGLNRVGVSRKIADEAQRRKLRDIMNELNPPKGLGFIVRTAGLERTKRELARDLAYLLRLWKVILRRIKKAKTPAPIYQESDMITRTIRDIFTSEIDTIWIDEPQAFERAQEFLRVVMPKFVNRLKLYDERVPLFHKYGIEDEIAKIQRRHVPLPEGGSIVIDQTEALVAIDVNSGNFRVENDAERTAYEMNLRAAKEIARQLRLRDLGGVIVNDFIDMREEKHRRGVERALREAIKRDRARTKVLRMSAFGLIEMTRQRIRPSLKRSVYEDCPNCGGAGVVKTVESMSIDVMRLLALASHREDIRRVNVSVNAGVAAHLNNRKRRDIAQIETDNTMVIHIRVEENAPAEHLQIDCYDAHNSEIRLIPLPAPAHRRPHTH